MCFFERISIWKTFFVIVGYSFVVSFFLFIHCMGSHLFINFHTVSFYVCTSNFYILFSTQTHSIYRCTCSAMDTGSLYKSILWQILNIQRQLGELRLLHG